MLRQLEQRNAFGHEAVGTSRRNKGVFSSVKFRRFENRWDILRQSKDGERFNLDNSKHFSEIRGYVVVRISFYSHSDANLKID